MKTWMIAATLGIGFSAAESSGAFSQAGSTGGNVGKQDKSVSGTGEAAQPGPRRERRAAGHEAPRRGVKKFLAFGPGPRWAFHGELSSNRMVLLHTQLTTASAGLGHARAINMFSRQISRSRDSAVVEPTRRYEYQWHQIFWEACVSMREAVILTAQ
jgi:hypothetical protein